MLRWIADSTRELISSSLGVSRSKSSTKWRTISSLITGGRATPTLAGGAGRYDPATSSETAGHVIFCFPLGRSLEDHGCNVKLNHAAQQEEAGIIGHAGGLLHVMRDDHDG